MPTVLDGRFQLGDRTAKIANGEVFRAYDLQSDLPAVVRILRPDAPTSAEFLARFQQECRVLKNLNHPNAEQVIATGLTPDNEFYVAFEDVGGQSLMEIIEQHGPLPVELVADYLDQLASVLDAAHRQQVIHRDVKPENIKVFTDEAGNDVVKLLGFVFAKSLAGSEPEGGGVTQPGMAVGSPATMSPEQVTGAKIVKQSDIYSLGVTLYAALTGKLPFEGRSPVQVMLAHLKEPIPLFCTRNPANAVPANVEAVVRKAMAKQFVDRPASAGELAASFRSALENPEPPATSAEAVVAEELTNDPTTKIRVSPMVAPKSTEAKPASGMPLVLLLVSLFAGAMLLGVLVIALLRRGG